MAGWQITMAEAWRQLSEDCDPILEEAADRLQDTLTAEKLAKFDKRLKIDSDFSHDPSTLVSEVVIDAKAIIMGRYELPLEQRTLEHTWQSVRCDVLGENLPDNRPTAHLAHLLLELSFAAVFVGLSSLADVLNWG